MYPHGQEGRRLSQCGHFANKGRGRLIFCNFVRTSYTDGPNNMMLFSFVWPENTFNLKLRFYLPEGYGPFYFMVILIVTYSNIFSFIALFFKLNARTGKNV